MFLVFCVLMVLLPYILGAILYRQTTYYKNTHNSYFSILHNKGLYGEYKTYCNLRSFEKQGAQFLFNCYIPRENGRTTEIDVVMIWNSGLYIFESKNYSGWIFGNERNKFWTQCLPRGKGRSANKQRFLNPIIQNKLHIRCLKELLDSTCPEIHSIIVFSDRCTFRDVTTYSYERDVCVIHRNQVKRTVEQINNEVSEMTPDMMCDKIYSILSRYSDVSDDVKRAHIAAIEQQLRSEPDDEETIPDIKPESEPHPEQLPIEQIIAEHVQSMILPTDDNSIQKNDALSALIKKCPRCGSPLALRTTKKGANVGKQFYGCSRFPKCRYTEQL